MNANDDTRIHEDLLALASKKPERNAYVLARPEIQKMVCVLVSMIRRIDPDWAPEFRFHSAAEVWSNMGDPARNWVWFGNIPYSRNRVGTATLQFSLYGRHLNGEIQPGEPGHAPFPPELYDPKQATGWRMRFLLTSMSDVEFLFRNHALEISFAKWKAWSQKARVKR